MEGRPGSSPPDAPHTGNWDIVVNYCKFNKAVMQLVETYKSQSLYEYGLSGKQGRGWGIRNQEECGNPQAYIYVGSAML